MENDRAVDFRVFRKFDVGNDEAEIVLGLQNKADRKIAGDDANNERGEIGERLALCRIFEPEPSGSR